MDRILAIPVFLLAAFATIIGLRNVRLAWSMRRWPVTFGEVRSSSVLLVRRITSGSRQAILSRESALPVAAFVTVVGLYFSIAIARWLVR